VTKEKKLKVYDNEGKLERDCDSNTVFVVVVVVVLVVLFEWYW